MVGEMKARFADEPEDLLVLEGLAPPIPQRLQQAPAVARAVPVPKKEAASSRPVAHAPASESGRNGRIFTAVTALALAAMAVGARHYFLGRQLPSIGLSKRNL